MLHVGFAEGDITPKLGSQSPGGMQARRLYEVHDPLKAVAVVIQNDNAAVALVGIDAVFIGEEATARARAAITAAIKVPGAHVLIGASHTRGGGPVATCFESDADPEYVELVARRVGEAVISAYHSLHAAELADGFGHEPSCQLGLDIKAASPMTRTWVVSLANQWIGYVATPSAYYAGGYEPRTARSAKMAPSAGQSLVEGSLTALKRIHSGPASTVRRSPPVQ